MYERIKVRIEGVTPLMLNNIVTANPLHAISKEKKKYSGKRNKTDADHAIMCRLDWLGALYPSESGTFEVDGEDLKLEGFGIPIIPSEMVEAMLVAGAKKKKLGVAFKTGVMVDGALPLEFPNACTIKELYHRAEFWDTRPAKLNGKTTIQVTRARFDSWALEFEVQYLPDVIDAADIRNAIEVEGQAIGTYRPRFGRFVVKTFRPVELTKAAKG